MVLRMGQMNKILVENKEKKEFAVLTNPIGDGKFGFLHWEDIQFFKDKNKAEAFLNEK